MRKLFIEGLATFGLVLIGTGACVINEVSAGRLGVVGVGLIWGATVWVLAAVSGAHMNPAVTLASGLTRREAALRFLSQAIGAFTASACLLGVFRERAGNLGTTVPAAGLFVTFGLEFAMTFVLVLAVLRLPARFVPAAAGVIVAVEAIFAGPLTGASMNPIRSLAPAIVSGNLGGLWIYLLAPMLGGWAAGRAHHEKISLKPATVRTTASRRLIA